VITSSPASLAVLAGQAATFSVVATGGSLSYQWQESVDGGASWSDVGTNAPSHTIASAAASMNGLRVRVIVSNAVGTATSDVAVLTVNVPPQILSPPASLTVTAGQPATFSVTATGSAPLAYQWQRSDDGGATFAPVAGATGSQFTLMAALGDHNAQFRVVVTNAFGSVTSSAAVLSVVAAPQPPAITQHPLDVTVDAGAQASFTVAATGTAPLAYQWQRGNDGGMSWADIPAATQPTLTLATTAADNGARFRAVVTNSAGSATSNSALLSVNAFSAPLGRRISGGNGHVLARMADGTVRAWGWNNNGQLGDGTITQRLSPVQVAGLINIVAVDAGANYSLALRSDGTVWAWGLNGAGQLGDGTLVNKPAPVQVLGLTRVIAIAAGGHAAYALRDDGTVMSWGDNGFGQLGSGVVGGSARTVPAPVMNLTSVVRIAAGWATPYAVRSDGTLWGWGENNQFKLLDGSNLPRSLPQQIPLPGNEPVTAVEPGLTHVLARRTDGSLFGWGLNTSGQIGDGTTLLRSTPVNVLAITGSRTFAACRIHSLAALDPNGNAFAWGSRSFGILGDGQTSGLVSTPQAVPGLTGVTEVGCFANSPEFSLALTTDGQVWTWGQNNLGQLGDGTTTNRATPGVVPGLNLN
jgi:alpha-tubulin suppressor-like RCC1 family protein